MQLLIEYHLTIRYGEPMYTLNIVSVISFFGTAYVYWSHQISTHQYHILAAH